MKVFLAHCKVPGISSNDAAITAAGNLISALQYPSQGLPNLRLETNHTSAHKQLAEPFNNTTKKQQSTIALD